MKIDLITYAFSAKKAKVDQVIVCGIIGIDDANFIPGTEIVDGLIILVAGAVLLTPGFLTDIFGFLLLLPFGRRVFRWWLIKRFAQFVKSGNVRANGSGFSFNYSARIGTKNKRPSDGDVIDVDSRDIQDRLIDKSE